jgi:hypothetical protein
VAEQQQIGPAYGSLVEVCKAHNIGRTTAFSLAARGLLETFQLGTRRYVYLESVRTLPERLKAQAGGA